MSDRHLKVFAMVAVTVLCLHLSYDPTLQPVARSAMEVEKRAVGSESFIFDYKPPTPKDFSPLRKEFRAAKELVSRTITESDKKSDMYRHCLTNYTALSGPFLDSYSELDTNEQRQLAESLWLRQQGKLWMSHSRKAGGTTLCMSLRLNTGGLIHANAQHWTMPKRQTCQIMDFCPECDLTRSNADSPAGRFQGWESMPRLIDCVTGVSNRNFIELEGTVTPPDLLTNPEYANFVFITTIRHPIARTISSLHNDPLFNKKLPNCTQPDEANQVNGCAHNFISDGEAIMKRCHWGVYFCYSNYFVRVLAGHPNGKDNEVTRHTLELAKRNFLRYSCVILQEQWKDTSSCLATKLGLHLSHDAEFNVEGHLGKQTKMGESVAIRKDQHSDSTFLETLTKQEYEQLLELNALDLEFYEWAKEQILAGVFTSNQPLVVKVESEPVSA